MTKRKKRGTLSRQWHDGKLDENAPSVARWSREIKSASKSLKTNSHYNLDLKEGWVVEVNKKSCRVRDEAAEDYNCTWTKNLDMGGYSSLAVGDRVGFSIEVGNSGLILKVHPRENIITRVGPKDRRTSKMALAANVDQVVVIVSYAQPRFNGKLLDRFLARLLEVEVPKIVCVNKFDLKEEEPKELAHLATGPYRVISTSTFTGEGLDILAKAMAGKKNVFIGASGVGKSTLIKHFSGDEVIRTNEVREVDGRGRHTTTRSSAYYCGEESWIFDTPGIRELPLWDIHPDQIRQYFFEFYELPDACQYRNCTHLEEQGCAVLRALEEGKIRDWRYASYRKMIEGGERNSYV